MTSVSPPVPAPAVRVVMAGGRRFVVPAEHAWAFPHGQYYERNVVAWVDRMVAASDEPVFYDLGANVGFYAVHVATRCRAAYAFEPVSATFAFLAENVRANAAPGLRAFPVGVSDTDGPLDITLWSSSGNNSIYDLDLPLASTGRETIELVRLDGFAARERLLPPTVMKLDIEGAELPALRGAQGLVERHRPALVLECQEDMCAAAGYRAADLVAWFEDLGYRIFGLARDHVDTRLQPLGRSDAVREVVALQPGSRVARDAFRELTGETLGATVTLAFLDDVRRDPEALRGYARAVGPHDDATLIVWAPGDGAALAQRLPALLAELGLDGEDSPDMLGLAAPEDLVGALPHAVAVATLGP